MGLYCIRLHLGYGDVIYDQPNNDSFTDKIKQLQYKAYLAITGAIQGTFKHGFLNTLNPSCNCSFDVEDSEHFFLRCLNFWKWWRSRFIDISSINSSFKILPNHLKVVLLLFGDSILSTIDNNLIIKASIKYTNRFSVPLQNYFFHCSIWESSEICACAVFSCLFFGYFYVK